MQTIAKRMKARGKRAVNAILAAILALGLAPCQSLGQPNDGDGNLPASACVIARVDDASALAGEPVVAGLDGTYLLSYQSEAEAGQAAQRLSPRCEFAEVDSAIIAAGNGKANAEDIAYGRGSDPFTLAGEALPELAEDLQAFNDADEQEEETPDIGVSDAKSPEAGQAEADVSGADPEADAIGDFDDEADADSTGTETNVTPDNPAYEEAEEPENPTPAESAAHEPIAAPDIALVDSGAPVGGNLVGAIDLVGTGASDECGHATAVAETIWSYAPAASVASIRVLDASGCGTVAATYAGIESAISLGAKIINLSLYARLDEESAAINAAIDDARAAGITVVTAAGNAGEDASGFTPANADGALTAGACDSSGERRPASNYGDTVDFLVNCESTSLAAASATGWLCANSPLADPLGDIATQFGLGVFFPTTPMVDGESEGAPPGASDDGSAAGTPTEPESTTASGDDQGAASGKDRATSPEESQATPEQETGQEATPKASQDKHASKAGEEPDSGDETTRAVRAAQTVTTSKTELRNALGWGSHAANRDSCAVPANEIALDGNGNLPLNSSKLKWSYADFSKKPVKKALTTHTAGSEGTMDRYGIWIPLDSSYIANKNVSVPGKVTLKWTDVASDATGERLDLALTISGIKVKSNDSKCKQCSYLCILSNGNETGESGKLHAAAYTDKGVAGNIGVTFKVTGHFYRTGTSKDSASSIALHFRDLDQADKTTGASASTLKARYGSSYDYVESVRLLSGFESTTYLQKDIAKTESNGDDSWTNPSGTNATGIPQQSWGSQTLSIDKGDGRFRATYESVLTDLYPSYMRTGFVARTTGGAAFSFQWWGSRCATGILSTYEGIKARDKNDPTRTSGGNRTDRAIITKSVNAIGQAHDIDQSASFSSSNHGGKRTSTSWRSTALPWKGSATYRFAAKEGYRVSKVSVKAYLGSTVKGTWAYTSGSQLKSITLKSGGTFKTTRDHDIVVSTKAVHGAEAILRAKKTYKDAAGKNVAIGAGKFSLGLYASKGAAKAIQTVKNDASGNFVFPALSYVYSDQKTYPYTETYYLHEVRGDRGTKYDDTWYRADVKVSYADDALTAVITYTDLDTNKTVSQPIFANVYDPHGGVVAKKVDDATGEPLAGAVFSVYPGTFASAAAAIASGKPAATATSRANGLATIADTVLPAGGKAYTIVETKAPSGYHLSGASGSSIARQWFKTFTLDADAAIADFAASKSNWCRNDAKACCFSPTVSKAVSGKDLVANEYEFQLKQAGKVLQTAGNDSDGNVDFDDIVYNASDAGTTFHYTIEEKKGTDPQTTYDGTWWSADVSVINGTDGRLVVEAIYRKHAASDAKPTTASSKTYATTAVPSAASSANKLTIRFHANGATFDRNANAAVSDLLLTSTYNYGASNFATTGLADYNNPSGRWALTREGYKSSGFWIVGTPTGKYRIHQQAVFPTSQALAAAAGLNLSTGNRTLDLYAEWLPDKSTGIWVSFAPGDFAGYNKSARATFSNSYEPRVGISVAKSDSKTGEPLAGASFEIVGADSESFIYGSDGKQKLNSLTITTDANGIASTDVKALVAGKNYRIRESKAPAGHAITDASWSDFTAGCAALDHAPHEAPEQLPKDIATLDGTCSLIGTWTDAPLSAQASIAVEKTLVCATGADTSTPLPIGDNSFTFALHEDEPDGATIATLVMPASSSGVSTASFPAIEYGEADIGKHTYYVTESPGEERNIDYDGTSFPITVTVARQSAENGGQLSADIAYGDGQEAQAATFLNVYRPSFDALAYKHGLNADGVDVPLAGARFAVFEVPALGQDDRLLLPEVFTDEEKFDSSFAIDASNRTYTFDAEELAERYGIKLVSTIESQRDGYAQTTEGTLTAGKAYAIIESEAPSGYLLVDPRVQADARASVFLIDDFAPDGSYAHLVAPASNGDPTLLHVNRDSSGNSVNASDNHGNDIVDAWTGYRYRIGSDPASAEADTAFEFENPRSDKPLGGIGVQKVDAETGAGLPGARFFAYDEQAFSDAYERYRADHGDAANDAEFLGLLIGNDADESEDAAARSETKRRYRIEAPGIELGPTDDQGYASTSASALAPGSYRVIETEPPSGYEEPRYDFTVADGSTGNVVIEVTQGQVSFAENPVSDKRIILTSEAKLSAAKKLVGGVLDANQFQFALYAGDDTKYENPLITTTNDAEGGIEFGTFAYSNVSGGNLTLLDAADKVVRTESLSTGETLDYRIREVVPDDATCEIDGDTRSYAELVGSSGVETAADHAWLGTDGITYDAAIRHVEVSITTDGAPRVQVSLPDGNSFENTIETLSPDYGSVQVKKVSEAGEPLADAKFTVTGATTDGKDIRIEIVTGTDGIGGTGPDMLPPGTYTVSETEAPPGYQLNDEWSRTFTVTADERDFDYASTEADWCIDIPDPVIPLPVTGGIGIVGIAALALAAIAGGLTLRLLTRPKQNAQAAWFAPFAPNEGDSWKGTRGRTRVCDGALLR